MKLLTSALLVIVATGSAIAQTVEIPRCATPTAIEYQESLTPGYKQLVENSFLEAKNYSQNNESKSNPLYTIPVVVHIVHNTPEQNLPDSVIHNQIQVLNEDYGRGNADTVNMRTDFDIVKGNPRIHFQLAQIDPDGFPTTGITRTNTSLNTFGSFGIITGDMSDLERVKSTADGGIDPWDQSRYMNIWVCNMSVDVFGQEVTALLGYATPPAGLPNWPPGSTGSLSDGVVIQYQAFGRNNPNPLDAGAGPIDVRGRTPVHEVGHYLGLRHIWGDGDCNEQDGIDDTPNADAESQQDCDQNKNTCTDNIQGVDLPDMIENYMDYSAETCQNSFTQGQVDLMHGVLELQRYDLVHNNPASLNTLTGVNYTVYPNPAEELINIDGLSNEKVSVINLFGQTVIEEDNTNELKITGLSEGTYLLKISKENGQSELIRFVKQ
jgi:hypothetical protein